MQRFSPIGQVVPSERSVISQWEVSRPIGTDCTIYFKSLAACLQCCSGSSQGKSQIKILQRYMITQPKEWTVCSTYSAAAAEGKRIYI